MVERTAEIAADCAFDLAWWRRDFPTFPCPTGHDELSWLGELVRAGRHRPLRAAGRRAGPGAWAQIDHELDVIGRSASPATS